MILNNNDLYQTIQFLSDQLRERGQEQYGSALIDALSISSVPGEILGETRLQLQTLRSRGIALGLGLDRQVDEALAYLDKVLGPQI